MIRIAFSIYHTLFPIVDDVKNEVPITKPLETSDPNHQNLKMKDQNNNDIKTTEQNEIQTKEVRALEAKTQVKSLSPKALSPVKTEVVDDFMLDDGDQGNFDLSGLSANDILSKLDTILGVGSELGTVWGLGNNLLVT